MLTQSLTHIGGLNTLIQGWRYVRAYGIDP